jgi:hypothetical protein
MYTTSQIKIEELMSQVGLDIRPYEISLRNMKNDDNSKIKYVYIHASGMNRSSITTTMLYDFNDDMTSAKFKTSFMINTTSKDSQYPYGLYVLKDNQEILNQFTKTEDYIKLLHVLSNKVVKSVYIDILGDISFPNNKPVIKNAKQYIQSLMFKNAIQDNKKELNPFEYIENKFAENGIFYEHEKMSEIVTSFEMLVV